MKYEVLISRDISKKRKRWIEGEISIEQPNNVVKLFELNDGVRIMVYIVVF